ncbi:MAG: cobalamin B12-binding domain-containing protein [Actinomycetota bacterium]
MDWEAELSGAVMEGDEIKAAEVAGKALQGGSKAEDILQKGAVAGVQEAGRLWQEGDFFLPDVILATEAYKEVMKLLEPSLSPGGMSYKGRVIIGSVEGDAHDIGKNIVTAMLRCSSYEVLDLGIDVPLGEFVDGTRELEPDILGMGAYMTTTMRGMEEVIRMLREEGLRDGVKVIVGGAAVTRDYAESIGADGYGDNAAETVEMVDGFLGVS